MAEVEVSKFVVVTRRTADQFGLFGRDLVNAAALEVTKDARLALQAVIGREQRLSGYRYNPTGAPVANAQGRRVNPYYRAATSVENPTAVCAVRGPAHFVEHRRRRGYVIRPRRARFPAGEQTAARLVGRLTAQLGLTPDEARSAVERHQRPPALHFAGIYRGAVRGGAIYRTGGPITRTFREAPVIIQAAAERAWSKRVGRYVADLAHATGVPR